MEIRLANCLLIWIITLTVNFQTGQKRSFTMLKVTFYCFSDILNKGFVNVEYHKSLDNARLRAMALNWTIQSVEQI